MTDRFAHHLRRDRIGDGERLDLVADESERGRSPPAWAFAPSTASRRM